MFLGTPAGDFNSAGQQAKPQQYWITLSSHQHSKMLSERKVAPYQQKS